MSDATSPTTSTLHVLLFPEETTDGGKVWIAQGLELDIAAHGKDPDEAKTELMAVISAEFDYCKDQGKEMSDLIGPAPDRFKARFDAASHPESIIARHEDKILMRIVFAKAT